MLKTGETTIMYIHCTGCSNFVQSFRFYRRKTEGINHTQSKHPVKGKVSYSGLVPQGPHLFLLEALLAMVCGGCRGPGCSEHETAEYSCFHLEEWLVAHTCPFLYTEIHTLLNLSLFSFYLQVTFKKKNRGRLGGSVLKRLPYSQIMIPEFWNRVWPRAPR